MRPPRAVPFVMAVVLGCTPDVELVHGHDTALVDASVPHWTTVASGTTSDLRAVWGTAADDVWAVGEAGTVIRWDGLAWRSVPAGSPSSLNGVWAARSNDAWIVGSDMDGGAALLHWDGTRLNVVASPVRGRITLRAVWGSGASDAWAVRSSPDLTDPGVWHWDGSAWRLDFLPMGRPSTFLALAGNGSDNVWVVGDGSAVYRRNAGRWGTVTMPPRDAQFSGALCVTSAGAVWAGSAMNAVHRYADATWTTFALDPPGSLRGLWCARGEDAWGVGDGGRVAHWNGSTWSMQSAGSANLTAVWGTGTGELWAVGSRGTVVHYGP